MSESVLAVLIITSVFLCLFKLSHMLTGKILLQHAAMRVARARAVGFNDFMCEKIARVAVIPVAGKRLWPAGDTLDYGMERARVPIYLGTPDPPTARGVLEYEGWNRLRVDPGDGTRSGIDLGFSLWGDDENRGAVTFDLGGTAQIEENSRLYLLDQGL